MPDVRFEVAASIGMRAAQVRAANAHVRGTYPVDDRKSCEQEGLIAAWKALKHFDPSRSSLRTFIERAVANHFCSLHRDQQRQSRFRPLQDHLCLICDCRLTELELRADVHRILNKLSRADRRLAFALKDHSPTEACRVLHMSRAAVYRSIGRIRSSFVNAGFAPRP
jgi:DNA-directed RNA polymerase specialized sigma24 family protein